MASIEDLKSKIEQNPSGFTYSDEELSLVIDGNLTGTFVDSAGATSTGGGILAGTGGSGAAAVPQAVSYSPLFEARFKKTLKIS